MYVYKYIMKIYWSVSVFVRLCVFAIHRIEIYNCFPPGSVSGWRGWEQTFIFVESLVHRAKLGMFASQPTILLAILSIAAKQLSGEHTVVLWLWRVQLLIGRLANLADRNARERVWVDSVSERGWIRLCAEGTWISRTNAQQRIIT